MRIVSFIKKLKSFFKRRKRAKKAGATLPVAAQPWLHGELFQEIEYFIRTQRSRHTQRAYRNDLKQFVGFLRQSRVSPQSLDVLLQYREWLHASKAEGGAGLCKNSTNRKFASVRAFLAWLKERGKIKENNAIWVKSFRAQVESPTQGFSDVQVAHILEQPSTFTRSGLMHSLILHFLFYLGLRRSELVDLKCSHLAYTRAGDDLVLTVRVSGKGDKERILPIPKKLLPLLQEYLQRSQLYMGEEKFLFSAVRNNVSKVFQTKLDTNSIAYIVKKYAKRAGIESRVSPHSCRATCISNALEQGASHKSVQQMAGWSSPLMIERYDKRQTSLKNSAIHVVNYSND